MGEKLKDKLKRQGYLTISDIQPLLDDYLKKSTPESIRRDLDKIKKGGK